MVSAAAMVLVSNVVQQTYHPPEKNTPPPDRALKKKPSHANHMLTKIFSRSTTASRADSESVSEETDDTIEFDELKGVIMPCPYINPLQHKLEPRIEQIRLRLPPTTSPSGKSGTSDASLSPITIARHRGETNRLLTGRISDEDLDAIIAKDAGASARFEKGEIPDSFDIVKLLDIDYVVKISAYDAITTVHWKEYLDCYIKGQFNIIAPPTPPAKSPKFQYLPAIYPPNEAQRIALSRNYNCKWSHLIQAKAGALIRAAMMKFQTRFASLSFFDETHERFRAENGYGQKEIARAISIGAHALYSSDVLVVLDTTQDWRFQNNPLVTENPKIRFFAGAPMLSPIGEVLGVFAVFGCEPRTFFTPQQRRELADFSSLVTTDLKLQTNWVTDPDLRSIPLLDRDSAGNDNPQPRVVRPLVGDLDDDDVQSQLVPPPLRYHRADNSPKKSRAYTHRQNENAFSTNGEQTPPSSAHAEEKFFGESKDFGNNLQQPSVNSRSNESASLDPLPTPDSHDFRVSTPRPFSSSDITSLNPHPPNTPNRSIKDGEESQGPQFDLTIEDFMSLADSDCVEQYPEDAAVSDTAVKGTLVGTSRVEQHAAEARKIALFDSFQAEYAFSTEGSEDHHVETAHTAEVLDAPPRDLTPSPSIVESSTARRPLNSRLDSPLLLNRLSTSTGVSSSSSSQNGETMPFKLAEACRITAQNLGYDIIYVVQIKPSHPLLTDQQLFASGGLRKNLITAHGLTEAMNLSSETHVGVLRSRGPQSWKNNRERYEDGEFEGGCLIAIHSEGGPRRLRSSGIIMGAFYKPSGTGRTQGKTTAEIERLVEAGKVLKNMILKPQRLIHPKRTNTEPTTPRLHSAEQATEMDYDIWKLSLDAARIQRGGQF